MFHVISVFMCYVNGGRIRLKRPHLPVFLFYVFMYVRI